MQSVYLTDTEATEAELDRLLSALEARARTDFAAQGLHEQPAVRRSVAMRYQGQNYEQEVAIPDGAMDDAALAAVYAEYGRLYESFYGYRLDGIPIEVVRVSVVAAGDPPSFPRLPGVPEREAAAPGTREVYFSEAGFVATRIARREELGHGDALSGPAIVEFADSTAVVPPGWALAVLADGILEVTHG